MEQSNIIILCFLYTIIGIFLFIKLLKKSNKFCPAYKGFIFGVIVFYIIIPVIVLLNVEKLNQIELSRGKYCFYTIQRFILRGQFWKFIYSILLVFICILSFEFIYNIARKIKVTEFNKEKTIKIMKEISFITTFIGGISLILFFYFFGGIKQALSYAEYLRAFDTQIEGLNINGIAGIFRILSKFVIVSPFLLIYIIRNDNGSKSKLKYKIFLIFSIIMSVLYFLFNAGRSPILMFVICFIYYILHNKVKKPWLWILLVGVISLPILDILDSLFVFLNTKEFIIKDINYLKYIYQFMFPYRNTLIVTDLVEKYGLRYGMDFATALIDIFPKMSFQASYVNTSDFFIGRNWKMYGGIPNDFITFAYIQFSFVGIIVVSGITGMVLGLIDKKLDNFMEEKSKYLLSAVVSVYVFSIIPYADFVSILKSNFILVILAIIILVSDRE